MIRKILIKDRSSFLDYCSNQKNSDLYITRNNKRLFLNNLKICELVFNDIVKRGDICWVDDEDGQIKGLLLIIGFSDKAPRKYVKIVADNNKIVANLLQNLNWNYEGEIFLKIKKDNPICNLVKKYGFFFLGSRGKEILFKKSISSYKKE